MPTNPYCVSGAGSSAVNGSYTFNSTTSSAFMSGYWEKISDPNIKMGYRWNYSEWVLSDQYDNFLYSTAGGIGNPPSSGWYLNSGVSPVPTVSAGECTTPSTPNTLRIKRSSTTTAVPTTLLEGELAANIIDKKIWIGSSTNSPVLISDISNSAPSQSGNSGKYLTTDGSVTSWAAVVSGSSLTASSTAPASPVDGDLWFDTSIGVYFTYVNDGTSSQWIETSNSGTTATITGLIEVKTAPTISAGMLTLNCAVGNVFHVSLNAAITSISFTNVPTGAYGLTLAFTMDGTARSVAWGSTVKWASGGTAPTLTSTLNKVDIFCLTTWDQGTKWFAMVGGQNF